MNNKKKYIFIFVILILLISILVYVFFFNEKSTNANDIVDNGSIDLSNVEGNLSFTTGGEYELTGQINGTIIVNTKEDITLNLNNVSINTDNGPCIYVISANNTYIVLNGSNTLTDTDNYSSYTEEVNGCIYSKDDLIISGDGTLTINANYQDGIVSKDDLTIKSGTYNINSNDDGIRGKDSVLIEDGIFNITSSGDAIVTTNEEDEKGILTINDGEFNITTGGGSTNKSTNDSWGNWNTNTEDTQSAKGIKASNSIIINNGTFTLNTSDDSIHSNKNIEINNGTYSINSGDDGIHADESIVIEKGNIDIKESYEGIESTLITINDGTINIIASDDGINIAGGNDESAQGGRNGANSYSTSTNNYLTINDGDIYVNSTGDGLDSNGSIYINGGKIIVDGPTNDGNGELDYDNELKITGGTLIAIGTSGMAQNISSSSTQNGVLINLTSSNSANTKIYIDGIIDYTSNKTFNSIMISTPDLKTGSTYSLELNGTVTNTFTISSTTTSVGNTQQNGNMSLGRNMR